jgi:hypothetical protein
MRLTFVNDLGQTFGVEIDPNMELENVMALLEAEVSDPTLTAQTVQAHTSGDSPAFLSENRVYHTMDEN